MSDLTPATTHDEAPAGHTPDTHIVQQQPGTAQPRSALVLALIALGFSIGLAVTAYFSWSQLQQVISQQAAFGARIGDTVQPLQDSVQEVSRQAQLERQQIGGKMEKLSEEQQSLGHRVSKLAALVGRSEQGWSLSEVEYLLRIANHRLLLQRDVNTAKLALRSADARLRELADPQYLGVREQIASELESLDAVAGVDRDGIYAGLHAWLGRVDGLTVAGSKYQPPDPSATAPARGDTARDWKQLAALVWTSISDLFRLREHEQPIKAMLPPEREYFLRENLRLQLVSAQLALLRDDPTQYRGALDTATAWLGAHFAADSANTVALLAQLEEFAAIDIRPDLPGISASLGLLRKQMKRSEQQAALPAGPETPEADSPSRSGQQEAAEAPAP